MAIKHFSYLDLTPEQRRKGAADARKRLSAMLAVPFLTPDQQSSIQAQLLNIDKWERGDLAIAPRPTEVRQPVNHAVGVGETVKVDDKTS